MKTRRWIAVALVIVATSLYSQKVNLLCDDEASSFAADSVCRTVNGSQTCQRDDFGERVCAAQVGPDGQTVCETCIQ
jgi:hypothetical protein